MTENATEALASPKMNALHNPKTARRFKKPYSTAMRIWPSNEVSYTIIFSLFDFSFPNVCRIGFVEEVHVVVVVVVAAGRALYRA